MPVEDWRQRVMRLEEHLLATPPSAARAGPALPLPLPVAASPPPLSPAPDSGAVFSTVVGECFDSRIDGGEIVGSARHEAASTIRLWTEICGDRPLASYSRTDMSEFRDVLVRIPKIYWKSASERAKPIRTIIKEATGNGGPYPRISNVTVNRHLSCMASVFSWCATHGHLAKNGEPFWTGFFLPTGKKVTGLDARDERPAYSLQQIERIFAHPVWTGRRSNYRYLEAGKVVVRDALYWGPLIAAYHGMRREARRNADATPRPSMLAS